MTPNSKGVEILSIGTELLLGNIIKYKFSMDF